jgi:5-methylcytosine-specific restriction endonuclease McrA
MGELTKRCSRCGKLRPLEEFVWRRKAAGKRGPYCRRCRAAYAQAHYAANRQLYIDRARRRKQIVGEQRVACLIEFLSSHPCVDCGETDPLVLEFDHIADKAFTIGEGLRDRNWESVLAEIAKCDVVCSNCHRRRTARRGGHLRTAMIQRNTK